MKGLLIKDIKLILKNKKMLLFLPMMIAILSFMEGANITFILTYTLVLVTGIATGTIASDEINNGFPYLFSLPIKRKNYVDEKYLLSIVISIIGIIIGILISFIIISQKNSISQIELIYSIAAALIMSCIIISVNIPIYLKYGVEKSRVIVMMIFFGISLTCIILVKIIKGLYSLNQINNFISKMEFLYNSPSKIILILLLIAFTIIGISYIISRKIINNKEF